MEFVRAIYHVMCRGDRRENIFEDDTDRARFPETLAEACQRTGWRIRLFMARPVVQSNEALTFQRRSDLIAFSRQRLFGRETTTTLETIGNNIMKKTTPWAILATAALTLTACDSKTADAVKEKADDAKQAVEAKTKEATESAAKKIEAAKDAAKAAVPAAAAAVDKMAEKAKDATADAANTTKEAADKAVDKVQDAATNALESAKGALAPSAPPTP